MRTTFIWIFGLLASAIVGGIIGSRFDADGGDYLLGGCSPECLRLHVFAYGRKRAKTERVKCPQLPKVL